MPRTRKNKKSNRRANPSARTTPPRTRRDGDQAAPGAAPSGLLTAQPSGPAAADTVPPDTVPPGLAPPRNVPARNASARNASARNASARNASARNVPTKNVPSKNASARNVPARNVPAKNTPTKNAAPGVVLGTGEYATLVPPMGGPAGPASARPGSKASAQAPAAGGTGTPPAGTPDDLPGWAAKATEELLTLTYWLDPGEQGDPLSATIRFSGRRAEVTGKPQPGDTFAREETVEGIIPGSGPVAITAEVRGINPGQWSVTARPVARVGRPAYRSYPPPDRDPAAASRAPWPRRVAIPAVPEASVHTASVLRSKVPGIIRFAYASLVSLGVLVGLGLEALLLTHGHYSLFRPMLFSVIAIVAGVIGGKTWYIAVHRGRKFDGWCIQGFVAGAAVVVAVAAVVGPGIPAGAFLAAAAPALLIGMAIGRLGCFWAGCCTGRPTASRRGIWSSDRRLGCRREPAQLLEALAALVSGAAVLAVVLALGLSRSGPAAVVGLAVYTLCRQFILGLRAEPRVWRYGRRVTAVAAAVALIAGIVLLAR
jgi:phosphatidylglycerol---prolipoprotein diacylglyceryl transferase